MLFICLQWQAVDIVGFDSFQFFLRQIVWMLGLISNSLDGAVWNWEREWGMRAKLFQRGIVL
jgi:thymidine kinase